MSYRVHKRFLPYLAMVKIRKYSPVTLTFVRLHSRPWNSLGFERLSRYMFTQNSIKLSAAVHELAW